MRIFLLPLRLYGLRASSLGSSFALPKPAGAGKETVASSPTRLANCLNYFSSFFIIQHFMLGITPLVRYDPRASEFHRGKPLISFYLHWYITSIAGCIVSAMVIHYKRNNSLGIDMPMYNKGCDCWRLLSYLCLRSDTPSLQAFNSGMPGFFPHWLWGSFIHLWVLFKHK